MAGQRVPPVPTTLKRLPPIPTPDRQPPTPYSVRSASSVTQLENTAPTTPMAFPNQEIQGTPVRKEPEAQVEAASVAEGENVKNEKDATYWRTGICIRVSCACCQRRIRRYVKSKKASAEIMKEFQNKDGSVTL